MALDLYYPSKLTFYAKYTKKQHSQNTSMQVLHEHIVCIIFIYTVYLVEYTQLMYKRFTRKHVFYAPLSSHAADNTNHTHAHSRVLCVQVSNGEQTFQVD